MGRARVAVGSALGLLAYPAPAVAASLSFTAPPSCPSQAEVVHALETQRGRSLAEETDVAFSATVVEQGHGSFRLVVTTSSAGEGALTRTLVAASCAELVTALVQVVSLSLGPPPEPEPPAPATQPEPPPAASPKVSGAHEPPPSNAVTTFAPPPPHERTGLLALLGVLDATSLGAASVSGRVEAGLHLGDVAEVRAGFGYTPSQTTWADGPTAPVGAAFALLTGSALGCAALVRQGLRLPACAGLELGSVRAEGRGVTPAKEEAVPWVAARLDVRAELLLSDMLRLALAAQLSIPLLHHRFYAGGTLVHEIPLISPGLGAGIEWSP